jgi:hypothetical protein
MSKPKKNARTQSAAATLSSVKKEMAKPRIAESARQGADTFANGGCMAVVSTDETARRAEAGKILLDYGKKVGS